MLTLEIIARDTIQSDSCSFTEDFAAVAVKLDSRGIATHAGIIIGYNSIVYLLHYTGIEVVVSSVPNKWYFHKKLDLIKGRLVPAFHAYCLKVAQKADPEYGFYYDGSLYDLNGDFFSRRGQGPQMMTCVGFCLSVILGFIEADEFFHCQDWEASTLDDADGYIKEYRANFEKNFPEVDVAELINNVRRIKPAEYFCSGFLQTIPIRKADTDSILGIMEQALLEKGRAVA